MRSLLRSLAATILLAMSAVVSAHAAPLFNLTYIAGTSAAAQTAFQQAANFWASQFYDNVTVNLTVGTGTLGSGILAQTSSAESSFLYGGFRNAMVANVTSATDAAAVASLPAAAPFNIYINRTADNPHGLGSATPYVDTSGANNSISTYSPPTVASVLASSATAALPPASRSAITPEPMTTASRRAVPRASASSLRATEATTQRVPMLLTSRRRAIASSRSIGNASINSSRRFSVSAVSWNAKRLASSVPPTAAGSGMPQ